MKKSSSPFDTFHPLPANTTPSSMNHKCKKKAINPVPSIPKGKCKSNFQCLKGELTIQNCPQINFIKTLFIK